jgi:hypothetical protein
VILLGVWSFGCSKEPILSVSLLSLTAYSQLFLFVFGLLFLGTGIVVDWVHLQSYPGLG